MVDSAEDAHFHWLASDGTRLSGSEQDLRAALSSGALGAAALVWRAGWAEWVPANRVAELSSSIPEAQRGSAREPKRDPHAATPPSPGAMAPLGPRAPQGAALPPLTPGLRPRRDVIPPLSSPEDAARDTLAPSSFGVIGVPRRAQPAVVRHQLGSGPPPPPIRGRSPLPTLSEEGKVPSATATLRPPGAVPPPPRAVPAVRSLDSAAFSFEKRSAVITPVPGFGPPGGTFETAPPAGLPPRLAVAPTRPGPPSSRPPAAAALGPAALTPTTTEPSAAAIAMPPVVNKALLIEPAPESIEPPLDSTLEVVPQVPPEARRTPIEALRAARPALGSGSDEPARRGARLPQESLVKIGRIGLDSRTVVMALSALCGALLVAVVALYLTRSRAPQAQSNAEAKPSASAPPAPPGCRLALPAARLAPNIERSVPPYATKLGHEAELGLGFAATKTKGVGLRLSPETLDVAPAFEEEGKDAVRGVVPLARSGSLAFFVDRDDSALRSAHTVDEIPPFTLGVSDAGFSRVVAGATSLVWPLDASVKITEPRAAKLGAFGYGIAFRRGGQTGAVLLGFVTSDGAKKSELVEIPGAPKFLGTPVIAGSAAGALVAFAGRDAPEGAWKLFVSLTKPGAAPSPAREFIIGSGGGAISPAVSPLAPDRWLIQWTEGMSGQYQVRVQSFASDLRPVGLSVLVSPKGANAGQGSLGTFTGGAATLFILTTAGHDELWGAALACP